MSRPIDLVIVHCAATPNGKPFGAEDIDRWHAQRGFHREAEARIAHRPQFKAIGYHYVIRLDGQVEEGRDLAEVGAHARGYNHASVGICLIGIDAYTRAQWDALAMLLDRLLDAYPGAKVIGHREVNPHKTCPGFDVQAWLAKGGEVERQHLYESPTSQEAAPMSESPLPKKPLVASKTFWGANTVGGAALAAAIPGALAGDPTSIVTVVVAVVGWITTIYGRIKAKQEIGQA